MSALPQLERELLRAASRVLPPAAPPGHLAWQSRRPRRRLRHTRLAAMALVCVFALATMTSTASYATVVTWMVDWTLGEQP